MLQKRVKDEVMGDPVATGARNALIYTRQAALLARLEDIKDSTPLSALACELDNKGLNPSARSGKRPTSPAKCIFIAISSEESLIQCS